MTIKLHKKEKMRHLAFKYDIDTCIERIEHVYMYTRIEIDRCML